MSDYLRHKVIAAPSTEAKQDTIIGYVDGVEAVLANILAKIIASPATEAKQTALNALIGEVQTAPTANTLLARLKSLEDKLAETLTVQLSGSSALIGVVDTVAAAGTAEVLADHACQEVTIIALDTNTGYIYVGGSDVSSAVYGVKLAAKDSITLAVSNTNLIYIDSSVNGEGISYVVV